MVMTLPKMILRLKQASLVLAGMAMVISVLVIPVLVIPVKSAVARDYIMRDHIVLDLRLVLNGCVAVSVRSGMVRPVQVRSRNSTMRKLNRRLFLPMNSSAATGVCRRWKSSKRWSV